MFDDLDIVVLLYDRIIVCYSILESNFMPERYQFQNLDVDGLMSEVFNTDERLGSREYKTAVELDRVYRLSLEQAHLIMHVFFVDKDAGLNEKIKMVAEVLLAGEDLQNEYPEEDILAEKVTEVKQAFDLNTAVEETRH